MLFIIATKIFKLIISVIIKLIEVFLARISRLSEGDILHLLIATFVGCWYIFCILFVYRGIFSPVTSFVLGVLCCVWLLLGSAAFFMGQLWRVFYLCESLRNSEFPRHLSNLWRTSPFLEGEIEIFKELFSPRIHNFSKVYSTLRCYYLLSFYISILVVFIDLFWNWSGLLAVIAAVFCTYKLLLRRGYGVFGTVEAVENDHLPNLYLKFAFRHSGVLNFPVGILSERGKRYVYTHDFVAEKSVTAGLLLLLVNERIAQQPFVLTPRPIPKFTYYLRVLKVGRTRFISASCYTGCFRQIKLSEVLELRSRNIFSVCGGVLQSRSHPLYYRLVVRTGVVFRRYVYFLFAIGGMSVSAALAFSGYNLLATPLLFISLLYSFKMYRVLEFPPRFISVDQYTPLLLYFYTRLQNTSFLYLKTLANALLFIYLRFEKFRTSHDAAFKKLRYLRYRLRKIIRHKLYAIRHNFDGRRALPTFKNLDELRTLLSTDLVSVYGIGGSVRFGPVLHALRRYLLVLLSDICCLFIIIVVTALFCFIFTVKGLSYFFYF